VVSVNPCGCEGACMKVRQVMWCGGRNCYRPIEMQRRPALDDTASNRQWFSGVVALQSKTLVIHVLAPAMRGGNCSGRVLYRMPELFNLGFHANLSSVRRVARPCTPPFLHLPAGELAHATPFQEPLLWPIYIQTREGINNLSKVSVPSRWAMYSFSFCKLLHIYALW